ncbi:hypothetical protein K502DRAFT_225646 [Neoconidiobolus thromboides FSU 785]|nr:hypothetical protein K502DRAFT_225646 [Neoconidiobolus thromboides FSU 785]
MSIKTNNKGKDLSDQLKLNWMPEKDCELNEEILANMLFNWHTLNSSQKTRLFNYFLINHGAELGPNFKEIPRLYEQNLALDRNKTVASFHNLVAGFSAHSTPKLYNLSTNNGSAKGNALKLKDKISKLNKNNRELQTFSYLCEEQRMELLKENSGLQLNKTEHFVYKQHEDSNRSSSVIVNKQRQNFKPLRNNSKQSSRDDSKKKDLSTSDVDSPFSKIKTENHMNQNAAKSAHNVITQGPANFLKDRNLITPEKAMFEKQQRGIHMMSQTVIRPPIDSIPGTFIRESPTGILLFSGLYILN